MPVAPHWGKRKNDKVTARQIIDANIHFLGTVCSLRNSFSHLQKVPKPFYKWNTVLNFNHLWHDRSQSRGRGKERVISSTEQLTVPWTKQICNKVVVCWKSLEWFSSYVLNSEREEFMFTGELGFVFPDKQFKKSFIWNPVIYHKLEWIITCSWTSVV